MSPNEAAVVLGVSPFASPDDVQRAYAVRLTEAGPDPERRDALTAARDALLTASAWQAHGAQPTPYPGAVVPAPSYPPTIVRRGMSTGAIVGITLGSIVVGLVVLLIAVGVIVAIGHGAGSLAQAGSGSSSAPADGSSGTPSAGSSAGGSGSTAADDYDVDGVHVHYVDGWTFELTPAQTCAGATITVGFSDTTDGDAIDEWTTTVDLRASQPYTLTVPDSASTHQYAGIDGIHCGQT